MNKIPCDGCISLPICKAESYNYDTMKYRINSETVKKCPVLVEIHDTDLRVEFLIKIRYFLRPDLKNETNSM